MFLFLRCKYSKKFINKDKSFTIFIDLSHDDYHYGKELKMSSLTCAKAHKKREP